ncbi:MAG: sodium:solute symporter family protein [Hydrogenothermaceae bacterium]|nr:sodium:solute symporter family protein [Hydrogenothermaceae bacterium]
MLLILVGLYLIFLIFIAYLSKRLIKTDRDYLLAGRSLPLSISTFALFATWFGSETILGASKEFAEGGFLSVIEEPFGAALCLILAGLFFVRPIYRMNILTFADFYRVIYGREVELLSSILLVISYFGWIAAQYVAFALILKTLTGVSLDYGILIAFSVSILMVYFGGMWAIALTDFIQTLIILFSLVVISVYTFFLVGGLDVIVKEVPEEYFRLLPNPKLEDISEYIVAWIVIGLGSIPSQDLFQRFMSSKSEDVAVISSIIAGFMYLSVAMLPLFIALYAKFEAGLTLLDYINTLNPLLKLAFFLGLLSTILSTSSAAILAPSAIISENLISNLFNGFSKVILNRLTVVFVSMFSLIFAFSGQTIYELVASSSTVTLVSLFAPLVCGIYCKKVGKIGAILSMVGGFLVWFIFDIILSYRTFGILAGLFVSLFLILTLRR